LEVLQVGAAWDAQAQVDPSRVVGAGLDLDDSGPSAVAAAALIAACTVRKGAAAEPLFPSLPVRATWKVAGTAVFQRLQAGEEGRGAGATQEPNVPLHQAGPAMV